MSPALKSFDATNVKQRKCKNTLSRYSIFTQFIIQNVLQTRVIFFLRKNSRENIFLHFFLLKLLPVLKTFVPKNTIFFMVQCDGTNKTCTWWEMTRQCITVSVPLLALKQKDIRGTATALVTCRHKYQKEPFKISTH